MSSLREEEMPHSIHQRVRKGIQARNTKEYGVVKKILSRLEEEAGEPVRASPKAMRAITEEVARNRH